VPTLFADDVMAAISWAGFAMAAITMIGGVANLLINKWSDRKQSQDKLTNETEKVELRAKVMVLEERQKMCLEGHEEVAAKLKHCEEEHHQSSEDRSKIWNEINALKSAAPINGAAAR